VTSWSPDSWKEKPYAQDVAYEDPAALAAAIVKLRDLPPLVTSWEVERLKQLVVDAQ